MTHYFPVDIETTGLDFEEDIIIEVAWTILGHDLGQISPLRSFVIRNGPNGVIRRLRANPAAYQMHSENGLLLEVLAPDAGEFFSTVIDQMLDDIEKHVPEGEKPYLLGNSVEFDRRMLSSRSQDFAEAVHYRNLDVRALQQIAQAAGVEDKFTIPDSGTAHRAADDIAWSISYAQNFAKVIGGLA
ncbi:exonuclease domain-containing protein [Microbacterium sp. zg-YB36]|uniref:exonuclease domain-containing protein n=1 Tax=Microbacterium sp. zg-YB36 TaxID=2969407 RepID=UPI00214B2887|nr:exonuclease domain-containing protein [Microbacterium sp. zg-YB36]MDL5351187.1 exonuclease domain-containing protein [Microbacterium sp. zg-YB36]